MRIHDKIAATASMAVPSMAELETAGADGAATQALLKRFEDAAEETVAAGAEVIETDFPVVENYEGLHPDSQTMVDRGLVPAEFLERELEELSVWAFDSFLAANGQPGLSGLAETDGAPYDAELRDALHEAANSVALAVEEDGMHFLMSVLVGACAASSAAHVRVGGAALLGLLCKEPTY